MTVLLYILFVVACLILIGTILLQPGKADAGALFTNSVSSTAFGPRGTATLLSKITIGATAAFMILAFVLSLPYFSGASSRSVLDAGVPATDATPAPVAAPATSPVAETGSSPAASVASSPTVATSPAASAVPAAVVSPAASPAVAVSPKKP